MKPKQYVVESRVVRFVSCTRAAESEGIPTDNGSPVSQQYRSSAALVPVLQQLSTAAASGEAKYLELVAENPCSRRS